MTVSDGNGLFAFLYNFFYITYIQMPDIVYFTIMKLNIRALKNVIILILLFSSVLTASAADHSDTSLHIEAGRHDARITDLYAFTRNGNLILILNVDPTVPEGATTYEFPTDVEYTFYIDNDSNVSPGGVILSNNNIEEDFVINIRFGNDGKARINDEVTISSILSIPFLVLFSCASSDDINIEDAITNFFAGPRDDPFIRGPRIGTNVAAIVLEIPLAAVVKNNNPLLIWATTSVDNFARGFQERAGGPFTSMLNDLLNILHPSEDFMELGIQSDVLVLDTTKPSAFPNGRVLEDDVVDIVCPGVCDSILANDAPFPAQNDKPFLNDFPYLAPPN